MYPTSRRELLRRALDYEPPVLTGMAVQDPREWIPEFESWAPAECAHLDRCFGGVGALHVAFSEWCVRNRSVPCTRYVFEQLLNDQGFLVCDALVSALVLKTDCTRY
jgi:hypothetical protein